MLSDTEITRRLTSDVEDEKIGIEPMPRDEAFQPASVDLRLGNEFMRVSTSASSQYAFRPGVRAWAECPFMVWETTQLIELQPGDFVLGTTIERVSVPATLIAHVDGKSSLGRIGLIVHATAGFIDPGFVGNITLEMKNIGKAPIILDAKMYICQINFSRMDGKVKRPYGHPDLKSKYQGQVGVTAAKGSRS